MTAPREPADPPRPFTPEQVDEMLKPCPYCAFPLCMCDHSWGESCHCNASDSADPFTKKLHAMLRELARLLRQPPAERTCKCGGNRIPNVAHTPDGCYFVPVSDRPLTTDDIAHGFREVEK
jgi:hypothetical protein